MSEQTHWSIADARELTLTKGAAAVVDALLARRVDAATAEAWISVTSTAELEARADEIDRLLASGADLPLAGVPFAVKDNVDVAGVATTAGCAEFAYVPASSAPVVADLLAAGAIYTGKTNLDQFATGLVGTRSPQYGPCRNPIVPEFIAGGSSSGSAVVVATGQVPIALGTDTAGSGRVPAALCGLVGMKPTPGVVSTNGVVPAMASFDVVSAFTATVADAATVFEVIGRSDRETMTTPRRVGIPDQREWFGDDDARTLFEQAVERVAALGCTVVEVDGAPLRAAGALLYGSALVAERAAAFGDFVARHPEVVDPAVRAIVTDATAHSAVDLARACEALRGLRVEADELWDSIDVLLTPTVARVPTVEECLADPFSPSIELGRVTAFVNPLGMAAIAVPSGTRASGVPFGVSFVGPTGSDRALIGLAAAFAGEAVITESPASSRACRLAVVGAHLTGQPLNHQLTDLGAVLVASTTTVPEYRLFALDTTPPKPGLLRAADHDSAAAIELEVWAIDEAGLGAFVHAIPAPLGVGKLTLADGSEVTGFLCEPHALVDAREITAFGGWRAYLASLA